MASKTTEWRPGPTVCRCCLTEGCYKDISTEYFWMGKREVYAEMLSETFDLTIAYSQSGGPNSNSRLICEPCISRLRDAADFKRQVQECERSFMQYLDPGSSLVDIEAVEFEKEVKVERVKEEKDHSDDDDFDDRPDFDDDDDYDDLDDEPLTKLASKVPKKESVDVLDLIDNAKATEKRKSSSKTKGTAAKKAKTKKDIATSSKEKPEPRKKKGVIIETDSSILIKDDDGNEIKLKLLKNPINIDNLICEYEDDTVIGLKSSAETSVLSDKKSNIFDKKSIREEKLTTISILKDPLPLNDITDLKSNPKSIFYNVKTVKGKQCGNLKRRNTFDFHTWKQNAITLIEFSSVCPFIHANNKYKCFVCAKAFFEAAHLREHSSVYHSIKDFRQELNNRVRDKNLKVDVTVMQCKICQAFFPNIQWLKVHLKNHGKRIDPDFQDNIIPFKLGRENFQCQICNETYHKLRLLIIHMSTHFNNYSCEICGSVFISLHLLKRHLQTHKAGNYPCEICDKVFSNSAKKTMHMRGVHLKQYSRTCPFCPERFNSNYQRSKHLRIIHNQSFELFRCETCGREYDLKYQLLMHIRSVHMQERNQECSICHSRFFSKYCLSRHMVIHTGDKNYKCEICGKAYARNKNLKEHMKSHDITEVSSICAGEYSERTVAAHLNSSHGVLE